MESDFPNLYRHSGYVFVVTYGRSGSTLTSNYLNSFPGYCIRGENSNLIYPLCSAIRYLENTNFSARRENLTKPVSERRPDLRKIMETPKDPWFGAELVDPDRFAKGIFDCFVRDVLSTPTETRVAGFKEVRWASDLKPFKNNIDIIKKNFPNAKFIFQTRDAEAVAKSGWWKDRPVDQVKEYVRKADAAFLGYASGNDACLHVRYEGLTDGHGALRSIAAFLGEDFCAETADAILDEKLTHLKQKAAS